MMKPGGNIVFRKEIKTHEIFPLFYCYRLFLLLASEIGQNLKKNMFTNSKIHFFLEK